MAWLPFTFYWITQNQSYNYGHYDFFDIPNSFCNKITKFSITNSNARNQKAKNI